MADIQASAGFNRFAADPVIAEINERFGAGLELVGLADHGDSGGAAFIRWPDGRAGVLTRPPASVERMRLTADVLARVRSESVPVPRHDLIVELSDGGTAVVQERLPGAPIKRVTVAAVDEMYAMNERFAGLLRDRHDVPVPRLYLRGSAPEHPGHDLLQRYNGRTHRVLRRIREIGCEPAPQTRTNDLLHTDFARGNLLFDRSGRISGVIDWNLGVARGDRRFALVSLRSDLEWTVVNPVENPVDPAAIERLDQILEADLPAPLLRRYWAYLTLQKLHWAIFDNANETIEVFLRLGEQRLDLC